MDDLTALRSLGLSLPSPAYLVGAVVFGLIGMAVYRHGKKAQRPRTKWLGVALMLYPYAISMTWLLYVVGVALCVAVYVDRD
jgi:chromate transport protein ChrA